MKQNLQMFPGQESDEKVVGIYHKDRFSYMAGLFIGFAMFLPVIVVFLNIPSFIFSAFGRFVVLLTSSYLLSVMVILLFFFVDNSLDLLIITNRRVVIVLQNGLFQREVKQFHLHQIDDVIPTVAGFLQTTFHFGNLEIRSLSEEQTILFQSVSNPYAVAKIVIDQRDQHLLEHDRIVPEKTGEEEQKQIEVEMQKDVLGEEREFFLTPAADELIEKSKQKKK